MTKGYSKRDSIPKPRGQTRTWKIYRCGVQVGVSSRGSVRERQGSLEGRQGDEAVRTGGSHCHTLWAESES